MSVREGERHSMTYFRASLKDSHQEKLDEIKEMIAVAKLEKMTILEQQVSSLTKHPFPL